MPEPENTMYLVAYNDADGENCDMLVVATTPVEAFELWRMDKFSGYRDYTISDLTAAVYEVPALGGMKVGVLAWNHDTSVEFKLTDNTLAMRAVRATYARY